MKGRLAFRKSIGGDGYQKQADRSGEGVLPELYAVGRQLSARRAGFRNPDSEGERLLCNEKICAELERLSELRGRLLSAMSVIGYQRLAFGSAADAASLLFEENPSREALGKMDLFLVSEIRRPKDGAMEIKFFDRARALEKLASLSMERESSGSLYDAIGSVAERSEGDD